MTSTIRAKIHRERPEGTYLHVLVPGQFLTGSLVKLSDDGVMSGEIRLDDSRTIRADQRKKAWAILGDIADWNGDDSEVNHWWLKRM